MTGGGALERALGASLPALAGAPLGTGVALALATLVSEDLTCVAAGVLVAQGRISFAAAAAFCLAGIFVGDLLLVGAGRWLGAPALARAPLAWLAPPHVVARGTRWFARRGVAVVLFSRFVPGSRLPLFLAAGALRAPFFKVAAALLLAGGVWTPLLVGLSAVTGGTVLARLERLETWALPAAAAAALAALLVARVLLPALTWQGRRLLVSRWRRLTRWEFWPLALFNLPVVAHVLARGLRHRHLPLFTAANPGLPAGGFVLESKSAILSGLTEPGLVPRFRKLSLSDDPGARIAEVRRAAAELGLEFPMVGKPDVGERGEGVTVLRSESELEAWARSADPESILQAYAPGEEFGVFYARRPGEPTGRILSITGKAFPAVTGDGVSTLERLILADERAVCQAPLHLDRFADRLAEVPAAGARVPLVEIGNHCRGTVFRDARALVTPELERRIEEIARGLDGFCFGRFDLRAPSVEEFRAGRGLAVLEVNGVTSEATHIYEPGAGLLAAWRTLFEQWRIAFEIGAANAARGTRPAPPRELLALLGERRRRRSARMRIRTESRSR